MEERPLSEEDRETLRRAVDAFNRGDYYEAHDLFESLWGEEVFKGLVQAAVALHHWSVGNLKGIEGLPERVDAILRPCGDERHGLDLARFRREFGAMIGRVMAGETPSPDEVPTLVLRQPIGSGAGPFTPSEKR